MAYDLQADLASAKAQTTAIYGDQYAPKPTAPTPTPAPTQAVVTSTPVRDQVTSLYDNINKMQQTNPTPGLVYNGQQYNDPMALIDAQRTALEQRRAQEVARIGAEFDAAKVGQAQAQRGETGTSSMGLARIGGFDSASGQAVLTNLQRVHESEQQALLQKRQAAIQQANNAASDKDFALAQMQLEKAKEAEQLIYDRQKDFVDLTLKIKGDQREELNSQMAKTKFEYEMQKDNTQFALDNNIKTPFYIIGGEARDTKTGERLDMAEYLKRGGKPDFSNAFIVEPGSKEARAYAYDMATKYGDAGIMPTDDPATIAAKMKNSRIYQEQVRPPQRSGGGGGGDDIKSARNQLISGIINGWQQNGWLNSGYIGNEEYKKAKSAYIKTFTGYVDNPGKDFDDNMSQYVNRSNVGKKDEDPKSTTYGQIIKGTDYNKDYGINN